MEVLSAKIKPDLNYASVTYTAGKSVRDYILSVQLGLDSCGFCVLDSLNNNKLLVLQTFNLENIFDFSQLEEKFTQLCRNNDYLQAKYKSCIISIVHPKAVLIPAEHFVAEDAESYIKLSHPVIEQEKVAHDRVDSEMINVYTLPKILEESLHTLFPNAQVIHYSTAIIASLLKQNSSGTGRKKVFINVQKTHVEIIVLQDKKLLFYNSFKNLTSEDFLYFVLMTLEQMYLSPGSADVTLLGEVEQNSALHHILGKYVKNVKLGLDSAFVPSDFTELPKHFHYYLLNQPQCVS